MSKNRYSLPLKEKYIKAMPTHSPAHVGNLKNAVDFTCNVGCEICSVADGKVVWLKDNSKVGGPDKKYLAEGNRIVIKHKNKEYSAYEHLGYKKILVKVGEKVKKGQLIGYSGNTGYTFGPHLHFEIFVFTGPDKEKDFKTLEVSWDKRSIEVINSLG